MDFWEGFWEFFWFLFWFYALVAFFFVLFAIISDLFRDRDLNGWLKAVWLIVLVFLPVISILVYLIARGRGMAERNQKEAMARQDAQAAYIRSVAGVSLSDEITKARALVDAGTITEEEYRLIKQKAVSG